MEFEREETALGAGGSISPESVRVAAFDAGLRAVGFSSSVSLAIVAVDALRRPKSSDGRARFEFMFEFVFMFVVGLVPRPPLQVAEAGNRGGAISPDLCVCEDVSAGLGGGFRADWGWVGCEAALEDDRRQPLKLSLRRREEFEGGVSSSDSVDVWVESDVSFFCNGRGPATMLCNSKSLLGLYSPLGRPCRRLNSPLPLGSEFEEKGVVACRVGFRLGIGIDPILGTGS